MNKKLTDQVNPPIAGLTDIPEYVIPHLNEVCQEATKVDVYNTSRHNLDGSWDFVKFFGQRVPAGASLEEAGKKLADAANAMSKKYKPLGLLGNPIKYDLDNGDSLCLIYFLFSESDANKIQAELDQRRSASDESSSD